MPYQENFQAQLFSQSTTGGWHFLALPLALSQEIRRVYKTDEEGWGRLKAKASLGQSTWDTAIWFDAKRQTYLLPIKADIRKKEKINIGNWASCTVLVG
jgi:Domain of unknown function (DUF1905)